MLDQPNMLGMARPTESGDGRRLMNTSNSANAHEEDRATVRTQVEEFSKRMNSPTEEELARRKVGAQRAKERFECLANSPLPPAEGKGEER